MTVPFALIEQAIEDIAAGRPVVLTDDADPGNAGDLIFSAEKVTPALVGFMVRHTSGFICVPMTDEDCDRLTLPPMYHRNEERRGSAYTVTVDAREGVTTGISAADRSRTIAVLAAPDSVPAQLSRPGHVVPLRVQPGGTLRRAGHPEAAVDLCRAAGLRPVGVIAEVVTDDGVTARLPDLVAFCRQHEVTLISIADLIRYRHRHERQVELVARTRIPTRHGDFSALGYRSLIDDEEHLALVRGDIGDGENVLVRVHSECLTGDVFGSRRCDCGMQLDAALEVIAAEGRGVVLYLRGHEARGIGLLHELQAHEPEPGGDSEPALGPPADARQYGTGAQILSELGVRSMQLLTNNPSKRAGLEGYGLTISKRVALPITVLPENVHHLRTKRDRMGHDIPGLPELPGESGPTVDVDRSVRPLSVVASCPGE